MESLSKFLYGAVLILADKEFRPESDIEYIRKYGINPVKRNLPK